MGIPFSSVEKVILCNVESLFLHLWSLESDQLRSGQTRAKTVDEEESSCDSGLPVPETHVGIMDLHEEKVV